MTYIEPFTDRINLFGAILIGFLSYIFGEHWVLFVGLLLLNVADYITGCMKSRLRGVISSVHGLNGVLKKLGYWIMVLLAFGMSVIFVEIGSAINLDLHVTEWIGWLVLASLIMNEIRSILENLVECGYNVPRVLVKSLEVANKAIDELSDDE